MRQEKCSSSHTASLIIQREPQPLCHRCRQAEIAPPYLQHLIAGLARVGPLAMVVSSKRIGWKSEGRTPGPNQEIRNRLLFGRRYPHGNRVRLLQRSPSVDRSPMPADRSTWNLIQVCDAEVIDLIRQRDDHVHQPHDRFWNYQHHVLNRRLRRARERAAKARGTHTNEEWEALVLACGDRCVKCGATDCHLDKDHITPVYAGGSDHITNL
jgi:hypothetical protein